MKTREHWIDIVKGIGIFLVVLGHIDTINGNLHSWIYSFHMPIFFLITGYLCEKKQEKNIKLDLFIRKKLKQLIYPYITFLLVAILYQIMVKNFYQVKIAIIKTLTIQGYSTLWFLITLFMVDILYYFLAKKEKKIQRYICMFLIIICSFYSIFFNNEKMTIIIVIIRTFIGLIFVLLGTEADSLINNNLISDNKALIILTIIFGINIYISSFNSNVDIHLSKIGNPIIFWWLSIYNSLYILIISKRIICKNKILEYIGKNSLCAMCVSSLLPYIGISKKVTNLLNINNYSLVSNSIIWIITILLTYLSVYIINKYFSFIVRYPFEKNKKMKGIY